MAEKARVPHCRSQTSGNFPVKYLDLRDFRELLETHKIGNLLKIRHRRTDPSLNNGRYLLESKGDPLGMEPYRDRAVAPVLRFAQSMLAFRTAYGSLTCFNLTPWKP